LATSIGSVTTTISGIRRRITAAVTAAITTAITAAVTATITAAPTVSVVTSQTSGFIRGTLLIFSDASDGEYGTSQQDGPSLHGHLSSYLFSRIFGQKLDQVGVFSHDAILIVKDAIHDQNHESCNNTDERNKEGLSWKTKEIVIWMLSGDTHDECHGSEQGIKHSMESIFLMHHGNVHIQKCPTTPKVCENSHHSEETKHSELIFEITQLHQHNHDDKVVKQLEKGLLYFEKKKKMRQTLKYIYIIKLTLSSTTQLPMIKYI
jgi:hypothetical protein